jgi:hypothetical protein
MQFAGLQFIEPANDNIDICAHNDFVVGGEFAEESIQSIKEAGINVLQACLSAWMVNRCKCQGKVLVALLPTDLLFHSVVTFECHIYADIMTCKFALRISCHRGSGAGIFPSCIVLW